MRFTDWRDCDMLPSGWRSDCYQDMSFRGYYETPAILPVGWPVMALALAYLTVAILTVRAVFRNDVLSRQQRAGYIIGAIVALPVFLPLYLVLSAGRPGSPDAAHPTANRPVLPPN